MTYDVLIIGGGPGGIYTAWELLNKRPDLKLALFESGHTLERRRCPIDGVKVKSCVHCPTCAIMNGFGGAGAFSDGKYNITNQFGGTLHEHIGKKKALELMEYVDQINMENGGEGTKLYSTGNTRIKKLCLENDLHLLDASVRHLGTDINYVVLEHLYAGLKDRMDSVFDTPVRSVDGGIEENIHPVLQPGWIFSSIPPSAPWRSWQTATPSPPTRSAMRAAPVSSPWAAAAASGWRRSARR